MDIESRLTRAADLRRYGVSVDWRLYTAAQMNELQTVVERQHVSGAIQPVRPPVATDAGLRFHSDDAPLPTYVAEELFRDNDDDDDVLPPSTWAGPASPRISPRPQPRHATSPLRGPYCLKRPVARAVGRKCLFGKVMCL